MNRMSTLHLFTIVENNIYWQSDIFNFYNAVDSAANFGFFPFFVIFFLFSHLYCFGLWQCSQFFNGIHQVSQRYLCNRRVIDYLILVAVGMDTARPYNLLAV